MISAGRVLLMPKGEYNASATYTLLDIVSYQGSSYVAKGTTTGNLPTDTTYWQLSAYGGAGASMAGNFATLETTEYASQGYSIGALLVDKDGKLCKVTDTILQNDEIIIDTNVEETTVEELLSEIYTYVDSLDAMDKKLVGQTAIITQTDLNDLKTVGEYYKVGTTFYVTNAPTGINEELTATFRLTVEGSFGNTELLNNKVTQTITAPSGTTYKRGYDGSTWSTWIEFATAAALATAVTALSADVTGATSLADGAHGLVPKPNAGDQNKFLKGDGTWTLADSAATQDSTTPVQSGAMYTALLNKQDTYSADNTKWDTAPTSGSTKPVTSGGLYTALGNKADKSDLASIKITGSKNNTGSKIVSETYFYKDGALVKAITDINNNATLTLNTNYKTVSTGSLNELRHKVLQTFSNSGETYNSLYNKIANYIKANVSAELVPHLKLIEGNPLVSSSNVYSIGRWNHTLYGYYSFTGTLYGGSLIEVACRGTGYTDYSSYTSLGYNSNTNTWTRTVLTTQGAGNQYTLII